MGVEKYEKDYEHYEILGTRNEGAGTEAKFPRPLKMTAYYDGRLLEKDEDWQRLVIPYVISDYFDEKNCPDLYVAGAEFRENCLAIIKGEHPEWHLGYAEVLPEALVLSFSNPKDKMLIDCALLITADTPVEFHIIGSEIAPGVTPAYTIHSENGHMVVDEEVRIKRRELHFRVKDPGKETMHTWHHYGNKCMVVKEYTWN